MRTMLRGKVTLLFMTCAVILFVFPAMASAQGAPTIQSDKADYAPGELVTLTGSGWQAGESVHINVNDTYGATWTRNVDVTADASGNITDSFNLPNSFVSDYDVTATGAQSGTATTTFTDGNVNVSGTVTDSVTNQPISGATVSCSSGCNNTPPVSATTDASGNYTFSGSNRLAFPGNGPATLTLKVSKPGYTDGTRTVNVLTNNSTVPNQNVALVPATRATTTSLSSSSNPSTYGNNPTFTATVTATGGNPTNQGTVTFKDGTTTLCPGVALSSGQASCTPTSALGAGNHSITADYSGTSSGTPQFGASSGSLTQNVNKKALTVTADNKSKTYGDPNPAFTFAYSGGFVGTDTEADIDTAPTCTSTATDTSSVTGSPYAITCSGGVDNNYSFNYVDGQLTVNKKALTVTADNKSKTYGDPNPAFTFAYSGGFVGTDTEADIDTAPTCTSTATDTSSVTGSPYAITCSGGVDNNYSFNYVDGQLTVNKKALTVTADNKQITLGQADPTFTFAYSGGFVGTDTAADIDTAPTCGVSVAHTNVGSYTITCSGGVDNNYSFNYVDGTLKIIFKFDGFRQPVDNNGVFNSAKAGQSIPIKFSLFGNQGLSILQLSTTLLPNPKVTSVTCPGASVTVDPIEEYATTTANNGLTYDATADQYNYVWKTQSTYANKCFKFDMVLLDGTHHEAFFQFKK